MGSRGNRRRAEALVCAFAAVLAIGAVLVLSAVPAAACSCAPIDDDGAFDGADVVFVGELIDYEPPPRAEVMTSADPATWTFGVGEVFKGEAMAVQDVQSAVSGATCGLELPREHATVLVFANHAGGGVDGGDGHLEANLCGGTRLLDAPAAFAEAGRPPNPVAEPADEQTTDSTSPLPLVLGAGAVALALAAFARHRRRQPAA
jgi:MYXO-CTERM domain-containing protein